jgi:uncharacterized cupredoxin-like copper-binding protein
VKWLVRASVSLLVASATAVGGYAMNGRAHAEAAPAALGPGLVTVDVGIRYSKFSISTLHVRTGTVVRFLIHNDDPIHHEFIVGDAAVHLRHEQGKEATHPPVPGEVSVAPLDIGETFYRFDRPGRLLFACHLPGHFAYGMRGWVVVDA